MIIQVGHSSSDFLVTYGPTLIVDIGFDINYNPKSSEKPDLGMKGVRALIDTGASDSCIDVLLASKLNLPMVDEQDIAGSNGAHKAPLYLAQIYIPELNMTLNGRFAGLKLVEGGQDHEAILGRSFLKGFKMTYDGKGGPVQISD